MSAKNLVGDVYAKVIDDVCAASRVDFEESGVEHGTLDLLKSIWQKKLSQMNLVQLPWDPKPEPAQPATSNNSKSAPSLPSNGHGNTASSTNPAPMPQIKPDPQPYTPQQQPLQHQPPPSTNAPAYPPPQVPQNGPMNAQQRAAINLYQRYGDQAGPQIAQLQQQQSSQPRVPTQSAPQQSTPSAIKEEDGTSLQDFKVNLNQAALKLAQTDGAYGNYESEIAHRRAAITRNRGEGDRLMKAHFLSTQQTMEGGGLLMPLGTTKSSRAQSCAPSGQAVSAVTRAQGDAAADEDEDEDAINSDLDDPNELENADEQEENVHEVMLCTYDKVQRVKNKWKCTLKDGILRVDGSEYVFQKGQGEFEW